MCSRILARLIAKRLAWWAEWLGLLDENQASFRTRRSTTDVPMLVRMEEDVLEWYMIRMSINSVSRDCSVWEKLTQKWISPPCGGYWRVMVRKGSAWRACLIRMNVLNTWCEARRVWLMCGCLRGFYERGVQLPPSYSTYVVRQWWDNLKRRRVNRVQKLEYDGGWERVQESEDVAGFVCGWYYNCVDERWDWWWSKRCEDSRLKIYLNFYVTELKKIQRARNSYESFTVIVAMMEIVVSKRDLQNIRCLYKLG